MARAERSVVVGSPIDRVFDFLADRRNNPRWRPEVVETILAEGPLPAAVWAQTSSDASGKTRKSDYRTSLYDEPTRLEYTVFAGPSRPIGLFTLRSAANGTTEVTLTVEVNPRWSPVSLASFGRDAAEREAGSVLGLQLVLGVAPAS
jgi:hypothetical protein